MARGLMQNSNAGPREYAIPLIMWRFTGEVPDVFTFARDRTISRAGIGDRSKFFIYYSAPLSN